MSRRAAGLLAMVGLVWGSVSSGCGVDVGESPAQQSNDVADAAALVDGTPQAIGVLGLLNDPATTFELLDDDVALDRRAAENLIAHRDGPDAQVGTPDDDVFDDIAEVDAVKYVGPSALDKLLAYATSAGYVPSGSDPLGTYDGVPFTVDEAAATLELANTAEHAYLDVDLALDARAVDSIVAARPIQSMPELEGLYYVGGSAMQALKDAAVETPKLGLWETCTGHDQCESDLCAGLTLWGQGWCFEAWQANTFSSSQSVVIPDDGQVISSDIEVSGLATVPLDVVVELEIDHPRPQDLHVGLHQPGGAYAVLWNHEASPPSVIENPNGIEGDNMVNGTWRLEVVDTVTGEAGTVVSWNMWISSNFD